MSSNGNIDFTFMQALLLEQTGHEYSVRDKNKTLTKFGRTQNADAGVRTTIAEFQGAVVNETFVTTNTIDSLVCDTADVGNVTIEGHTIDGEGNLSFVVQTVALTGTTPVALTTPIARCNRIFRTDGTFASPAVPLTGNVYVYDSSAAGGLTGGTPNNAAATHCMIRAGFQQSYKGATAISSTDAWVVTHMTAGLQRTTGAGVSGDVELEIRGIGGVFRPSVGMVTLSTSALTYAEVDFETPILVYPNSDVRSVITVSGGSDAAAFVEIAGYLVKRVVIPS